MRPNAHMRTPVDPRRPGQEGVPYIVRFELLEAIGGETKEAAAKVLEWGYAGGGAGYIKLDNAPIVVHEGVTEFTGEEGDRGYAIYMADNQRFEVLGGGGDIDLVPFQFTASMSQGGNAAAVIREWNGTSWVQTGESITVHDPQNFGPAENGDRGWCVRHKSSGRHELVSLAPSEGGRIVTFVLTEAITAGGTADAKVVVWNGTNYVDSDPLETITVSDVLNDPASPDAHGKHRASIGARGVACELNGQWEILELLTQARYVRFTVTAASISGAGSTGSATVDDFWDGHSPGSTCTLRSERDGKQPYWIGDTGVAVLDEATGLYSIIEHQGKARLLEVTAIQPMGKGETYSICRVTKSVDGRAPVADNATIEFRNSRHIFEIETDKKGLLYYVPEGNYYEVHWWECPSNGGGSNSTQQTQSPPTPVAAYSPTPGQMSGGV